MSYGPPFTPQEEREFGEWDFQRRREGQLDYFKHGVPLTARHQEWIRARERQTAQQTAWTADGAYAQNTPPHSQAYPNSGRPYSYAGQYQAPYTSAGPSGGVPYAYAQSEPMYSEPTYSEPASTEPAHSDYDFENGPADNLSNGGAPSNSMGNAMTKVCRSSAIGTNWV
jgi:hypothetical protein